MPPNLGFPGEGRTVISLRFTKVQNNFDFSGILKRINKLIMRLACAALNSDFVYWDISVAHPCLICDPWNTFQKIKWTAQVPNNFSRCFFASSLSLFFKVMLGMSFGSFFFFLIGGEGMLKVSEGPCL